MGSETPLLPHTADDKGERAVSPGPGRTALTRRRLYCVALGLLGCLVLSRPARFLPHDHHPCPSPRELHRSALQLPVLEPSPLAYLALPSLSPHFNVSFAHSPLSCNTFHLRIARRNSTHCLDALRLPDPSLDPELSSYVRRTLGPDSFRVVVDGAQKFATEEPTYEEESCSWRFDVQLRAVDEVRVKLWWMYEDYGAFRETTKAMPPLKYEPLIRDGLQFQLCPRHCPSEYIPALSPSLHLLQEAPHPDRAPLPLCTANDTRGSFLAANSLDLVTPPFPLPRIGNRNLAGNYVFVPLDCRYPTLGGRLANDQSHCTSALSSPPPHRRALMLGDSHARVAYDSLVWRIFKGQKALNYVSEKWGSKNETSLDGGLYVEYVWDPKPHHLWTCAQLSGFDTILISAGAHESAEGFTTAQYLDAMTTLFDSIKSTLLLCSPSLPLPTLTYMSPPAQPPRSDAAFKRFNDKRTNPQLHYWGSLVGQEAMRRGWNFVNQYELTMGFAEDALAIDGTHYLMTDSVEPILDELVSKMGLCGVRGT